jgi:hypothetical protein
MAFTLANIITEVRANINEAAGDNTFWSDTEITNWIKQGCLDFTEKSLTYVLEDTITVLTNTVKYTTSGNSYIDNAVRCLHAEYSNKALQRVSYEQLRGHNASELASDPAPKYYYDQYNGLTYTFYIGPKPSSTYNSTTLTVLFASRTDDVTKISYEYQPSIILYATARAKAKDRQFQEAMWYYNMYMENVKFARLDALEPEPQPTDNYRIK